MNKETLSGSDGHVLPDEQRESGMKSFTRLLSLTFAAGVVGALANSLVAWIFGSTGITVALGVKMAPALTPAWIYPRLVWGGLWGLLFILPLFAASPVVRGIVYSIPPTLVQLMLVFPHSLGKGMLGMELGTLTPAFVVLFNAVWGIVASLWLAATESRR